MPFTKNGKKIVFLPFDFFPSSQMVLFSLLALAPGIFDSSSPSAKQSRFSSCTLTHDKILYKKYFLIFTWFFSLTMGRTNRVIVPGCFIGAFPDGPRSSDRYIYKIAT